MIAESISYKEKDNLTMTTVKKFSKNHKWKDVKLKYKQITTNKSQVTCLTLIMKLSTMHQSHLTITISKVYNSKKTSKTFLISIILIMNPNYQNKKIKKVKSWKNHKLLAYNCPKGRTLLDWLSSEKKEIIKWGSHYCKNTINPNQIISDHSITKKTLKVLRKSFLHLLLKSHKIFLLKDYKANFLKDTCWIEGTYNKMYRKSIHI